MKFNKIFLIVLLSLLIVVGAEAFISYIGNHSYYGNMLLSGKNLAMIIGAFACGFIPLHYLHSSKNPQLLPFIIRIGIGLAGFSILHTLLSKAILSIWTLFPLLFNTLLLYTMSIVLLGIMLTVGNWIVKKLKLFRRIERWELLLTFGIGLIIFLLCMQLIMWLGLFHGWLLRVLVIGIVILGWVYRHSLIDYQHTFDTQLSQLQNLLRSKRSWILIILILASFAYYYFGFIHSYIPYPTAWDANHEYMYTPKVIAESGGILWGNTGPADGMPYIWHGLIAFCFAFWQPLTSVINIAADTFAINMNFLSGILVLLFWLAVIREVIQYFVDKQSSQEHNEKNLISFFIGWGLLLLRLTSGMGAFLVFVDNKTDMGVLSLVIMALLAGWKFLNHTKVSLLEKQHQAWWTILLVLSAIFFAFAVMAKPTAFIDVVVFGLVLIGIGINTLSALGAGIAMLGLLGILQPLFTSAFLGSGAGKVLLLLGILIAISGLVVALLRKNRSVLKWIGTIGLWGGIILISILVFKAPRIAVKQSFNEGVELKSLLKSSVLGYNKTKTSIETIWTSRTSPVFLAQSSPISSLREQENIDLNHINHLTEGLSFAQCKTQSFTTKELAHWTQKAPGNTTNEDFGRYVGFGAREFPKTGLAGIVLKLLFWKNNACFGRDTDGLLLCQHREDIAQQNFEALKTLAIQLSKKQLLHNSLQHEESPALQLLNTLLEKEKAGEDLRDAYKALETYYQEHSILTKEKSVMIPYRYIVPLNAIFNRSLQNHSSYYTDIGLIWLFVLIFLIGSSIYALVIRHRKLLLISMASSIGWVIWRTIAAGIVWYGLGLIIRSVLVTTLLWQQLQHAAKKEKNTELLTWVVSLFALYCGLQAVLNFTRIASQASDGPFAWYRSNVGSEQFFTPEWNFVDKISYRYTADNVFKLQFGQYSPFLHHVAQRTNTEGILIAGTYLQYFLHNHHNIRMDGLLNRLWEQFSDYNSCKSYHRLKAQQLKYLVIDPNIGTVGRAGQGNESLFYRFFAKLDPSESSIQTPGAITMLTKFAQEGYLKLIFTNNIGAKYAFSLSNEELRETLWELSEEELILVRAKLAVAKFFVTEHDLSLLESLFTLFQKRLGQAEGIEDVANILNRSVNGKKLLGYVASFFNGKIPDITWLDNDEKLVLIQYLGLVRTLSTQPRESVLLQFLQNSIFGSSQIITLELE